MATRVDDIALLGPYPEPPTQFQVDQFQELICKTGEPERIPKLCKTKPDLQLDHKLVCIVDVALKNRSGGEMIPCTLCSDGKPKFLYGRLLWSTDGQIRLIGNCCAAKYFGVADFRNMLQVQHRDQQVRASENFLLDHLPRLPDMLVDLRQLGSVSRSFQDMSRQLSGCVPSLANELRRMVKGYGGTLVVLEKTVEGTTTGYRSSTGGGSSEYVAVPVGQIQGQDFLSPSYAPHSRYKKIEREIIDLHFGRGGAALGNDVVDIVCELGEDRCVGAAKRLATVGVHVKNLMEKLQAAPAFLSDSCVSDLAKWSEHPANEFRFTVDVSKAGVSFRVSWQEHITLSRGSALTIPQLSAFDL